MKSARLPLSSIAALALLTLTALPSDAAAESLRAGAAAVDITPTKLPVIIAGGFLEGKGVRVNDPLFARCLVLDDGGKRIAFAIVDTCMMTRQLIDDAKQLASAQCGIPVDHMMVSATHTHSAPAAMGCLGTRQDKDYAAWLPGKIAEGIVTAAKQLQPAKIGWASVDDWEHTHNRRWIRKPESKVVDPFGEPTGLANMHPGYLSSEIIGPSGPVDPGLSVLSVQTRDGKPLAVLANYSQHYFGASPVSADYYGLFCKHVARLLGQSGDGNGPFLCAMSQGTSGDLMWMDYGSPKKTITADAYAEAVAERAVQVLKQIRYRDNAPLAIVEKKLTLNYRVPDEKRLEWARPIAAQIENDFPKDKREVYAREALILHERQKTDLKLQAIRIGELSISTLPNEVYAITGLKLKAQSPFTSHFNIELANGAEGYIPPPEQHVLGGYTTWPARTAGLEVQAEPKIVAALLDALEEATGGKRRPMQDDHGPYASAVLDAKPAAYWRLNEAAGRLAQNAVAGGPSAEISDGVAWYLPGAGSGSGTGPVEKLVPSAFSGPRQINRAPHLAGGDVHADIDGLGKRYSIALWFGLGEASGASERSGSLILGPGGESLTARQFKDHRVEIVLNDSASKEELRADDWHFAVLVRDGEEVRVHLDGNGKPGIVAASPAQPVGRHLHLGKGMQGKLDEVAVFQRVLTADEIGAFWKASGVGEQRARESAARESARKQAAERARPPKFPATYAAAIAAMKPVIHE
ncbi:MAG: LamG-like jellyroll fold domain-containing protein, partial [Chthoniobacteraceae bacterium]